MNKILGEGKIAHDGFEHWPNDSEGCEYCSARALSLTVLNLEAENERLRAALERYGRHETSCYYEDCSCGLSDALRGEEASSG